MVPGVQKKTGPVAKDVDEITKEGQDEKEEDTAKSENGDEIPKSYGSDTVNVKSKSSAKATRSKKRGAKKEDNHIEAEDASMEESHPPKKKSKTNRKSGGTNVKSEKMQESEPNTKEIQKADADTKRSRRRSSRAQIK